MRGCIDCGVKLTEKNRYKSFMKRNIHLCKECTKQRNRKRYTKLRLNILSYMGNKCVRCDIDDHRVLQIDHIKGNGNRDTRYLSTRYKALLDMPLEELKKDYQLLCANCNWIKRHEEGSHGGSPRWAT